MKSVFSLAVGFGALLLSGPNLAWTNPRNLNDTLSLTLSIDVTGSVEVTPFLVEPDGTMNFQAAESLTGGTGYMLPEFVMNAPQLGVYSLGVGIFALEDSIININTTNTVVTSALGYNIVFRPTDPQHMSISPSANETTALFINGPYTIVMPD
jgi:hypothetical protein